MSDVVSFTRHGIALLKMTQGEIRGETTHWQFTVNNIWSVILREKVRRGQYVQDTKKDKPSKC